MTESDDSNGGRRASQDPPPWVKKPIEWMKARWNATCARWPWLCNFLGASGNDDSNKFWNQNARLVIWLSAAFCAALLIISLLVQLLWPGYSAPNFGLRDGYYITILVAAGVGALMAAWRARQFQKSLEQTERQLDDAVVRDKEARFAIYLQMAASGTEATARTGFLLLEGMLPDFSKRHFMAVHRLILSTLSIRESLYEEIRKDFDEQSNKVFSDAASENLKKSLRKQPSTILRQEAFDLWKSCTREYLKRICGYDATRVDNNHFLMVENKVLRGLNFSYLKMTEVRPVYVDTSSDTRLPDIENSMAITFAECLFVNADLGGGMGLKFYDSICLNAQFASPRSPIDQSKLHKACYSFTTVVLCKAVFSLSLSSTFKFRNTNITEVKFLEEAGPEGSGCGGEDLFWDRVAPFASAPDGEVYWIIPSGQSVFESYYHPKFLLWDKDEAVGGEKMKAFLRQTRCESVPEPDIMDTVILDYLLLRPNRRKGG